MDQKIKHYDWLFIIKDWNFEKQFRAYKKLHPKVKSEKRLARGFVKSMRIPLIDRYLVGKCVPSFNIAKVNWL